LSATYKKGEKMRKMLCFLILILLANFTIAQERDVEYNQAYDVYEGTAPYEDSDFFAESSTFVSEFQYGLNIHWASGQQLDWVTEVGASWVRTGVGWEFIEPELTEPPTYNWEVADKIINDCRVRNLKILWGLPYTPKWASDNGQSNGVPRSPVAQDHWRRFVRATAERYRNDIDYYDPWNEPNNEKFWLGTVDEYVAYILKPAWEEIKAVDPNKKIVGPALKLTRGSRIKVEDFFWRLGLLHASRYIDIIGQNVYQDEPEDVTDQFEKGDYECFWIFCLKKRDSLFKIYRKAGFEKHMIWINEFGWRSDKVGEGHQAKYIVETLGRISRRPRFTNAFIYELQDDPRFQPKWGIMKSDGSPKKTYWQLRDTFSVNPALKNNQEELGDLDTDGYGNNVFVPKRPDRSSLYYFVPRPQ
jgi:hypothetical protein